MKLLISYSYFFIVFFLLFTPNIFIQAQDESFFEKIDYSNVDVIGLIKSKGKG